MYRLIMAYRAKGTVSSVEPRAQGRRKDTLVLDANREKLIASTIHEIYLKPERPTMTYLIEQGRGGAQKGLPLPDRRTIKARVDRIDLRTVALRRKDTKGVKAKKGRARSVCDVATARSRADRSHRSRCFPGR